MVHPHPYYNIVLLDSLQDDMEIFSFFQFYDIDNLLNISKKLAKLGDFTLEKNRFMQNFPKHFVKKTTNLLGKKIQQSSFISLGHFLIYSIKQNYHKCGTQISYLGINVCQLVE
jgi:hypothetical protein